MEEYVFADKLLFDFIEGKESALDQIYLKLAPKVYNVAFFLLKDNGWSDDVVQEEFIKLWENREKLHSDQNLWSYLYVLTKRSALNKLRGIKRSNACFEQFWSNFSKKNNDLEDHILAKELSCQIERFVENLPLQPTPSSVYTDSYSKTGFADQIDVFSLGAYTDHIYMSENPGSVWSVENFVKTYDKFIQKDCKVFGSFACYAYGTDAGKVSDAVYLCLKNTDGLMTFEISHVINNNQWSAIKAGIDRVYKK